MEQGLVVPSLYRIVIWASNYPLRAKVWAFQENTPDFIRIDEADFWGLSLA